MSVSQERDLSCRELSLRLQLGADEAERHDPVLLGRPQQAVARPVPRFFILERHLAEPRQRISDVRGIVDRQATTAVGIDVGKGAVGQLRALSRTEPCHARMFARLEPQTAT